MFKRCVLASVSILALAGCANMSNQDQGALIGMAAGGIIGNQVGGGTGNVIATLAGALIGGAVGSNIGRMMDEHDRRNHAAILETTRTNQTSSWRNPDTEIEYRVTPRRTTIQPNGLPCREYTGDVLIGGKRQQIYGYACRQADGSWRVVR